MGVFNEQFVSILTNCFVVVYSSVLFIIVSSFSHKLDNLECFVCHSCLALLATSGGFWYSVYVSVPGFVYTCMGGYREHMPAWFACTYAGVLRVHTGPNLYVCILRVCLFVCVRLCLFVCVRMCLFLFVSVLRINIIWNIKMYFFASNCHLLFSSQKYLFLPKLLPISIPVSNFPLPPPPVCLTVQTLLPSVTDVVQASVLCSEVFEHLQTWLTNWPGVFTNNILQCRPWPSYRAGEVAGF